MLNTIAKYGLMAAIAVFAYALYVAFEASLLYGSILASIPVFGWIALAAIVVFTVLLMVAGKPKDQSLGAGDAPSMNSVAGNTSNSGLTSNTTGTTTGYPGWLGTWSPGSVIILSSGIALMAMGINLSPSAPISQIINVPAVQLPGLQAALSSDSGQTITNPVGDIFVLKNPNSTGDDHAAIVTANPQGNGDTVQVVTLDPNGNVVGQFAPSASYKPLLVPSASNPTGLAQNPDAILAQQRQLAELNLANSRNASVRDRYAALNLATQNAKYVSPGN